MAVRIQLRHDTAANWTSANPTLLVGELGLETDTNLYKIGDGSTAWNSLSYTPLAGSPSSPIIMNDVSDPSAPADGVLNIYSKNIAGRSMLKMIGHNGVDVPLQPALFSNSLAIVFPGASNTLTYVGTDSFTVVGTLAHPTLTNTSIKSQATRAIIFSSASANSASELRSPVTQCFRGNGSGLGGFFMSTRFGIASVGANQRLAVGLFSVTTALSTSTSPSSLTSCVFVGNDSADTYLQVMHNDATGTCTKVNLGVNFPAASQTAIYKFDLFARPNDNTKMSYRVCNLENGAVATGDITTDLVDENTFLSYHAHMNNGGTSGSVILDFMRFYLEKDY